ncbi:erythromycin esterase family protein [Tessaracoccus caeni]|uniref:erythromycin esterase family protein n=1 Tax=Tessaracoccus caeni TaxID=3031239 RepID=UPI0023DCA755|nr:erythromycin esterase family protein [Tessaracoccus caeni]MDF1488099.1 erythromycin esterase family protein [Tessaracoccus caeni]
MMTAHSLPTPPAKTRRRVLTTLLVVLAAIALLAGGAIGWSLFSTRAQGTPDATEFAEAIVSDEIAVATVLALGEATHGNAEFQFQRLTLVQKLPQFRAIMLEEDYGNTALVDAFIQGGPGTAEDAAKRFGFRLNHTVQMAELLHWLHDHNAGVPDAERIRIVGVDTQRVDASKDIALSWLAQHDEAAAEQLRAQLAGWTDDSDATDAATTRPVVDELVAAVEATPESDGRAHAVNAATALSQGLDLASASDLDYIAVRAQIMAANVGRTVEEEAERGNEHSFLFAHNGHVDKASAAFAAKDLGALLVDEYGDGYRVIGTEVHHSSFITGRGGERWEVSLTNRTPLRGMFDGTAEGYLEFATAAPENRELLNRPVRMASAGEGMQQWQAWIPWFNSVEMTPETSYDALILVESATPVTPL